MTTLLAQPRLLRVLSQAENIVYAVTLSPDGKLLAAGGCGKWKDPITCQQSLIQLWDTATGKVIGSLLGEENTSAVHGLAFRPDGKTLLATSEKGNLVEWDIASQKSLGAYRWHEIWAPAVVFSPDRTWMAIGSCAIPGGEEVGLCSQGGVFLYDTLTHQQIGEPLIDHERYVYSLSISPDGTLLASGGGDSRVYLHNLVDGTVRLMLEGAEYDAFFSLAFSPDGKTLAAGNTNGEIYLIDVVSGATIGSPLIGHDIIFGLAFHPDGKMLASGGCALRLTACSEGEVILWDPAQRTKIGDSLTGFQGEMRAIEFSMDGSLLVGGYEQNLVLWSANTEQTLAQNLYWEDTKASGFLNSSAFSPDGQLVAASRDNFVGIWNAADGTPVNVGMTGHVQEVRAMRFSPDGSMLYTASKDKTVILWDAATGTEIARPITGDMGVFLKATFSQDGSLMVYIVQGKLTILSTHTGAVIAQIPVEKMGGIAFNSEGTQVAVYGCTQEAEQADAHGIRDCLVGGVEVYEVSTGKPIDLGLPQRQGKITGFAFSPDGKFLAVGGEDRQILLWDREAQAASGAAVDLSAVWTGKYGFPFEIAYSPNGKYLVVGNKIESEVLVIDLAARAPVGQPIDPCTNFSQFAFSPDGQTLVVGCTGIQFYDMLRLEPGEKIGQDSENGVYDGGNSVSTLAFSPDGRYLINGDTHDGVHVWDLSVYPAQPVATLRGHASALTDLAVADDGKVLVSVSADATINRWDISALGSEPGTPVELPLIDQPVQGYANQNANVAFSLDASLFASASCQIGRSSICLQTEVQVYELPSGRKLSSFQVEGKRGKLAISPDGEIVAIYVVESTTGVELDPPGKVIFWNLKKQAFDGNPIEGLKGDSYALQYSPDGKTIAVSTSVSGALYQATGSRELLFQLSIGAYSFAFSSDSSYLAEGLSRLILIREMQQGKLVGPPLTGGFVLTYGLSFNHAGTQLASGDNSGHLLLWNLNQDSWISLLCQKANRNLSAEEWKTYLGDLPYQESCLK